MKYFLTLIQLWVGFLSICASYPKANIWIIPSVESPQVYRNYAQTSKVHLEMARGEVEHIQLVFPSKVNEEYRFTFDRYLKGIQISARELKKMNGYYDALVPFKNQLKCTDTLTAVWITVQCPSRVPVGKYHQTIKIEGSKHFTIQLDYNVHHTIIPLKSSIPITVGVENRCMTECLNDKEADKERQRWVDFVLSYRMTPVFGTQITPERWQYEHSFSPWAWNDKRSIRLLNDRRYSCYMLPFFTLSENELASLLCNIQKKGKLKESLFYIWDEPAYMEDYEQIKRKVNIIRKYASDARILTTFFCGPRNGPRKGDLYAVFDYLKHHIHVATISLAPCKGNEEEVQHIRYKVPEGIDWWSYVCWQPGGNEPNFLLQMKGIQQRAIMWRTWKNGSQGFLYWNCNIYHKRNPFTYITDMPHGDGILIYPGDILGCKGPIASARLERWRDGAEEMELLRLVEKNYSKEKADTLLNIVYSSPLSFIEKAHNIPFFRKELLDQLDKTIPIDYKLRITDFI